MAFGITPQGFALKPLQTIVEEIGATERLEIDPGLDLDPQSLLGQINSVHGAALAELWELGQAVYNAAYPDSASGDSLDNVSSITGTVRDKETKTKVKDVTVTLEANTTLPASSVANLISQPSVRFTTDFEVSRVTAGTVLVDFTAETAGAIAVTVSQLKEISEPVAGWLAVDNLAGGGETGDSTETDSQLRLKRLEELEQAGSTNVNSIRANLRDLDGVVDAVVFENDTDAVDAGGRPPHSVHAVLRGGTAADIEKSIFDTKAAGIATFGANSGTVTDTQGVDHTINWDTATEQVFFAVAVVVIDPQVFDAVNGENNIKVSIKAYVDGLGVGGDVIYDLVKCAIFADANGDKIPGVVKITSLTIGFSAAPTGTIDLVVAGIDFASSDVANIDLTTGP